MPAIKNKAQKARFVLVGIVNTAIDFGFFFLASNSLHNAVIANYISTSIALAFSFFANKNYTFESRSSSVRREISLFLAFTLFGLWVLQPLVILGVEKATHHTQLKHALVLLVAKVIATVVSLIWNYATYSRFVFKSALGTEKTQ